MATFSIVFVGQAFSLLGSRLVQFTLVWWLTIRSGSASVLAFASITAILPQVILGPLAGTLVDRWNRRLVLMVSDSVIALTVGVLALLYLQGSVQVWHIYAVMFVRSLGGAFQWPTMQASTSLMVPSRHLSRVSGLTQSLHGVANILAPPLGALLLEVLPIETILAIDIGTAILAVGPLFIFQIPQPPDSGPRAQRSILTELHEGARFMRRWTGVLMIVVIAMIINLLSNPAFSLLPLLVTEHFKGQALDLSVMQSAFGIGMILGGVLLGVWGGSTQRVKTALSALVASGVAILVLGLAPPSAFLIAVGAFFAFGFVNSIANASFLAALQTIVPSSMQGRIFTLLNSGVMSMSPLGLAVAGPIADVLSIQFWFLIAGAAMTTLGLASLFIPTIRRLEEQPLKAE
jgi:DHA3 family macrolide efflux protein-like MFS transporter